MPNFKNLQLKNFKPLKLLRYLPTIIAMVLLVLFVLTIIFLYQYFYQTIAQAKVVSILKNQVALNQVNMPLYQKVFNAWDAKKQFDPSALENIRDTFRPLSSLNPNTTIPSLEEVNTVE